MWERSSRLYDHAHDTLRAAIASNNYVVEIVLEEEFEGDFKKVQSVCAALEIGRLTEVLRSDFRKHEIKSSVSKRQFNFPIDYKTLTVDTKCPLVWEISWRKKM